MFFRAAWILIPLLAIGASRSAIAEVPCGPAAAIAAHLGARWKEGAAFEGIVSDKARMVLFVNADTRTWTIVVTRSDGVSCVLLAGSEGDIVPLTEHPGNPT